MWTSAIRRSSPPRPRTEPRPGSCLMILRSREPPNLLRLTRQDDTVLDRSHPFLRVQLADDCSVCKAGSQAIEAGLGLRPAEVRRAGLEPATRCLEGSRSVQTELPALAPIVGPAPPGSRVRLRR